MSDPDDTLFALTRKEYNRYTTEVLSKRRIANEYLNHFLIVKSPDEWVSFYALLCEYIAILHRFEEALEKATLTGQWDNKYQSWLLEKSIATSVVLFASSEISCRDELLNFNVSFSTH